MLATDISPIDYLTSELGDACEARAPMTLVVGLQCDDALFLAADSMVQEEGIQLHGWKKLQHVQKAPLAWGWSGDHQKSQWLSEGLPRPGDSATWRQWSTAVAGVLASLNNERITRGQITKQLDPARDLTGVLLAGYVAGEPSIVDVNARGDITFVQDRFLAIGAGSLIARTVFETLRRERPQLDERFALDVISLSVKLTPSCGFPAHVLKITAEGVSELTPVMDSNGCSWLGGVDG